MMRIVWLILVLVTVSLDLPGEESREITWEDLLPSKAEAFDDPFLSLSEDQLLDLGMIARIRFLLENEKISADGPDAKEEMNLRMKLKEQGVDVDYLLSQRERVARERRKRAEAVDASVDGSPIRIPGYMLPLVREEGNVREFLLVPWVGACIHTPPPPPNQMIHVATPIGIEDKGRFSPVWVSGTIMLKPKKYDLFLVDGTREINVAYTLTTKAVEPYSSKESDVLAKVEIPKDLTVQHSLWQNWQSRISLLLTKTMTDIKDRESSWPLMVGLFVAFAYGVVHTLGPGHGKAVVVAYFVGEGGSLWRGMRMGGQIALFHVLSALSLW